MPALEPAGKSEVFAREDARYLKFGVLSGAACYGLLTLLHAPLGASLLGAWLTGYLAAASGTDLSRRTIPHAFTLAAVAGWALLTSLGMGNAALSLIGGSILAVPFLVLFLVNPDGVGGGDVAMAFVIGLCLGPTGGLLAFGAGTVLVAAWSLAPRLLGRPHTSGVPLAPYLFAGSVLSLVGLQVVK